MNPSLNTSISVPMLRLRAVSFSAESGCLTNEKRVLGEY